MKKILSFLVLNFCVFAFCQNLNLKNPISKDFELPQKMKTNDIAIIYETNGGWSAYDYVNYYFISSNGILDSYSEEKPKAYLKNEKLKRTVKKIKLTQDRKEKIIQLIKSKQLSDLLKYNQEDFKIKIERKKGEVPPPPPCMISDSNSYRITFIQNNKQNSYGQYAPKYYYEKCTMKTINKPILKKFIDVIDLL